jgi:short-subunit dehydrogenase involved in D-alanine esterification of teichoic acids
MSVTLTVKSLERDDWFKVVKVFFYAAVSLGLAVVPAVYAHNPMYVALAAPINAVLVGLRQTVKQEEQASVAALPVTQQAPVESAVNEAEQVVVPALPTPPAPVA